MNRQIRLNAFDMNCIGHIQHGMWSHPRDRSADYNTLEYWRHLARTAERGLFDGIFLADAGKPGGFRRSGHAHSVRSRQIQTGLRAGNVAGETIR